MISALLVAALTSGCDTGSEAEGSAYVAQATCTPPAEGNGGPASSDSPYTAFKSVSACGETFDATYGPAACAAIALCGPNAVLMQHFGLLNGVWVPLGRGCETITPTLTPALISSAFAKIPLPHLRTFTQPADATLVNLDTIFWVEAQPFTREVTLLGQTVTLAIRPASYRWRFGDGTTATTTTPGAAYPSKDVTHAYPHTGTVQQHVEITWTAQWRVGNGPWADVPGSVTTTGPDTTMRVREAVPTLSGNGH